MMSSASPSTIVRSSLEEMLDLLQKKDENEKPKDLPPALPARPTSKGRFPPAKRSLPNSFNFKVNGDVTSECSVSGCNVKEETKRKEKDAGSMRGSLVSKKMKKDQNGESPYFVASENDKAAHMDGAPAAFSNSLLKNGESDWDNNIGYFMRKKLRFWCRLSNGQWMLGTIQSKLGEEVVLSLSNGNVVKVSTGDLLPANPEILEGVDDLMQLSFLNDPSVIHNLRHRYFQAKIYSKAGPVLIALNPFKEIKCYGNDIVVAYWKQLMNRNTPHVYAVADAAYNEMLRDCLNQSIIISGESGAGKTETSKIAMRYFVAVGCGSCGMENRIIQANCILEAFGNAKTSRNDNSSRYGKLVEVCFNTVGKICGAKIQTLLLEKSRVVQLDTGERSYHVFYQLCTGAPSILRERLNLKTVSEYKYLNQSECLSIDGVDDAQKFQNLMEALDIIQISKEDQDHIFAVLAALLWLGNISFQVTDSQNHVEVLADEALVNATKLIGCNSYDLMLVLSTNNMEAVEDSIAKKLTLSQAIEKRDALARFIYANLFDWLLVQINKSLEVGKWHSGKSISILDIYGFESFKKNSFEQFCINYANERLQQHFNCHLFKLEREDCELNGIDWNGVVFEDNQECLSLIEQTPLGLIALLDEESNLPKATDLTFANKLKHHLSAPCFIGQRGRAFGVHHYAGEVLYDTNGFLVKNRDFLPSDIIKLLSSSSCKLLQSFASRMLGLSQKQPKFLSQTVTLESPKQSLASDFKEQVFKLMHNLENTKPHFIYCVKPNSKRLPDLYEEDLILQQLRSCQVLEVMKSSKTGYPIRMTHQEFAERYAILLKDSHSYQDPLSMSVAVLQQFNIPPEMYQVGYTKLFVRSGQVSRLDEKRQQVLHGILGIQKRFRGHQARHYFQELKNEATILQSFIRGEIGRRKITVVVDWCTASVPEKVELQAVIQLQSVIRGWLVRKRFNIVQNLRKLYPEIKESKQKPGRKSSEIKDKAQKQVQVLPSDVAELQMRVLKAEASLQQKEKENAALREQVQQSEAKWSDYAAKMKSMEEMWRKQMSSLQRSLVAATGSQGAGDTANQPGRVDAVSSPLYHDSEYDKGQKINLTQSAVNNLVKEFEHQKQSFDSDAKVLVEVRPMQPASTTNPDEEIQKLKLKFEAWKKEYKVRLRETKAKLRKHGHSEGGKKRRKWWEKLSSR